MYELVDCLFINYDSYFARRGRNNVGFMFCVKRSFRVRVLYFGGFSLYIGSIVLCAHFIDSKRRLDLGVVVVSCPI